MNAQTTHIIGHINKAMTQNTEEIKAEIFALRQEMNTRFDLITRTSGSPKRSKSPKSSSTSPKRNVSQNQLVTRNIQNQMVIQNTQITQMLQQMSVFNSLPGMLNQISQQLVVDKKQNDADRVQYMLMLSMLNRQTQDALRDFKKATTILERLNCDVFNPNTYEACLRDVINFLYKILYKIHYILHIMIQVPVSYCPFLSIPMCECIAYIIEAWIVLLIADVAKGTLLRDPDYPLAISNGFIRLVYGSLGKLISSVWNSKKDFAIKVAKNVWTTTKESTNIGGIVVYVKNETSSAVQVAQDVFIQKVAGKIGDGFDRAVSVPKNVISSMGSIAASGAIGAVDIGVAGFSGAVGLGAAGFSAASNLTKHTRNKMTQGTKKMFGYGGAPNNFDKTPVGINLKKLLKSIEHSKTKPDLSALPVIIKMLDMFIPYFLNEMKESTKFANHKYNINFSQFNINLARTTINILI